MPKVYPMVDVMMDGRRRSALSGVALLALLAALPACSHKPTPNGDSSAPAPTSAEQEAPASIPWCGEGFRPLDDANCLAVPEHVTAPASVVVYAHGMLAPGALPTHEQATLLAGARAHGFAVLFGHGKAGLCTWDPGVAEHLCWPTQQAAVDEQSPVIVAGWAEAQRRAEAMAGVRFEKRYVLGFSNGGYYVAHLALEGHMPMDGAGVVGAGRSTIDEASLAAKHPPLYLAVGEEEAETTRTDAANLSRVLTAHDWPVQYVVHAGRGHELHEDDLAAAWGAWGR